MKLHQKDPWAAAAARGAAALFLTSVSPAVSSPDSVVGEGHPDKSGYTLFNPTPEALMRKLSADQPDKTGSPFTVDAGHFQLEMDFANLTYTPPTRIVAT